MRRGGFQCNQFIQTDGESFSVPRQSPEHSFDSHQIRLLNKELLHELGLEG